MTLCWLHLQRPYFQTLGIWSWICLIGWHSSMHSCDSFKTGEEAHHVSASNPTGSFISVRINLQLWCWPTRSGPDHLFDRILLILGSLFLPQPYWLLYSSSRMSRIWPVRSSDLLVSSAWNSLLSHAYQTHKSTLLMNAFIPFQQKLSFLMATSPEYREALANAIHLKSKKQTNDNNNRNWRDQEEKNPYLVTTECIIDDYIPEKNALSHLIPKQHWKLSNIISFYGE